MRQEVEAFLRSPVSGEPLMLSHEWDENDRSREVLICPRAVERFPLKKGIPRFIGDSDAENRAVPVEIVVRAFRVLAFRGVNREECLRELEIDEGDRVLEVSVGDGTDLRSLPRGAHYFCVDASWPKLNGCRRRAKRWGVKADLFCATDESLPFQSEIFDAVFHASGFASRPDRAAVMGEMVRVAKPGAKLVVADDDLDDDREIAPGAVPAGMVDVRVKEIADGALHSLTFRKPL